MQETNFFQSWAFWFLAGIVVGFAAGFALAIIIAAGSNRSKAEERISEKAIYEAERREGCPESEIATQGKPEDN